jgi:4-phospho-D-threonate 3-dehydrogenase / 4-phospho-D-erythronate 3-dehydrogenase
VSTAPPTLALTLGDPAGIGPEIVARTLAETAGDNRAHGVAVGDAVVLRRAVTVCNLDVEVRVVPDFTTSPGGPGVIDVLDIDVVGDRTLQWGQVDALAGRAAITAIEVATEAALHGQVTGMVTAPINKQAIWAAGSKHLGHTEMLGELTDAQRFTTMFVVRRVRPSLKIFFTTRHTALRKAIDQITRQSVYDAIQDSLRALRVFGHDQPRLAVAALNPHGGEDGAFGDEEIKHIRPACDAARDAARAAGAEVAGPIPADSVFHQGLMGRFDGVLSHFHDQGHIAAKTVDFDGTVSVTIGLPILRTSVDHGTAFDIAGTGKASHGTMRSAYEAGVEFAPFVDRIRVEYAING